jgi:tight adherence protein C
VSRITVLSALGLWVGFTLWFSTVRWFRRVPLLDRVQPYHGSNGGVSTRHGIFSVASFGQVVGPLAEAIGARVSQLFGIQEPVAVKLTRVHSTLDASAFRVRQVGWAVVSMGAAALLILVLHVDPLLAAGLLLALPLLVFGLVEQQLVRRSDQWKEGLFLELPVVSEQLGMLLSSGWSLGSALARIAERSQGCCGRDLARVGQRTRQGLSEAAALAEWAELAKVDAVSRLTAVLALNRETSDLGKMISDEARSIRAEAHRRLVGTLERREQMVWIPVTVATLVPGAIFLSIPFISVMRVFARGA